MVQERARSILHVSDVSHSRCSRRVSISKDSLLLFYLRIVLHRVKTADTPSAEQFYDDHNTVELQQ